MKLVFPLLLLISQASCFSSTTTRPPQIVVLGSTGFLGKQVVSHLDKLGVEYKTVSKSPGCDFQLDLSSPDAALEMQKIAKGCDAVISTVGSIGTDQDEVINAASGQAAIGAKQAGVKRFVFIGNDPRVREFSKKTPLKSYAAGKEKAEAQIRESFPGSYTIIQPNFIYGGEVFSLSPPRVPSMVGQLAEDILGLYPFQAASDALPGVFGLVLGAPVSRERVAAAAVNAALGLADDYKMELSSRDDIIQVASKRPKSMKKKSSTVTDVKALKQKIYNLGDCKGTEDCLETAFDYLEEIELLGKHKPASDQILNGRWDFVFDIEADVGTGVVKDILEGNSPVKAVFNLEDLYMVISDNKRVEIMVSTKVLGTDMELILHTTINADESDPSGTQFSERFEGMELAGVNLPIPDSWRQSRPLEFSYLDEDMLIARGNGGEPHYLKR